MGCKYKKGSICKMLSAAMGDFVHIPDSYCESRCGDTDDAKNNLLIKRGFYFDLNEVEKEYTILEHGESNRRERLQKEHEQLLSELPTGLQLAKNLQSHLRQILAYYKKTGRVKVSAPQQAKRLEVCRKCEMMVVNDGVMRCKHKDCGCYLNNPHDRPVLGGKAEYAALTCDLGYWINVDKQYEV